MNKDVGPCLTKIEQLIKPFLKDNRTMLPGDAYNAIGWLLQELVSNDTESKDIHLYIHFPEAASSGELGALTNAVNKLTKKEEKMDQDIQALIDQAQRNEDAEDAGTKAINDLGAALLAAIANAGSLSATDRAALQAKVTEMQTHAAAISAAIVANTPAQPA